jgi:hypothetical protein
LTLKAGDRIGNYEIVGTLGQGGMGVVYRAIDHNLARAVAIKVLPLVFTRDPERVARFEREASLLAQLNHPNIAHIYGLERSGESPAFVMELVDGPTVAELLARGAVPLDEAVGIARQLAAGLAAAHERGIIHRDLKPANIKVSANGTIKILDFGLAKAIELGGSGETPGGHDPSTITLPDQKTREGTVMGTAAYMSPEQARGAPLDRRTDIWSFGVVLYEMVTGKSLFAGDSVADTLANVLKADLDFSHLTDKATPGVERLLRLCLERNAKNRLHDISDVRVLLDEATSSAVNARAVARRPARTIIAAVAGALICAAAWWVISATRHREGPAVFRGSIVPPTGQLLRDGRISPDGSLVALELSPIDSAPGTTRLYVRPFRTGELTAVPESEGASLFDFSPESQWLYFVAPVTPAATHLRLARVPSEGNAPPVTLRDWDPQWTNLAVQTGGEIVVSIPHQGFIRLAADGSPPGPAHPFVSNLPSAVFAVSSQQLPDGTPLVGCSHWVQTGLLYCIAALDPATGRVRLVLDNGGRGVVVSHSQIVFARGDELLVTSFDPKTGRAVGQPRGIMKGLRTSSPYDWSPIFGLSNDGTLLFTPGGRVGSERRLVTVEATGAISDWSSDRMSLLSDLSVAADGRIALAAQDVNGESLGIWVTDPPGHTLRHATVALGRDTVHPLLSRDGLLLASRRFTASPDDGVFVRWLSSGAERRVTGATAAGLPLAWTPGTARLLVRSIADGKPRLLLYPVSETSIGDPRPVRSSEPAMSEAAYSPDGNVLAFVARKDGIRRVFAAPSFEDSLGAAVSLSPGAGSHLHWSADGHSLLFSDEEGHLLTVPIATAPKLSGGTARVLLDLTRLGLTDNFGILPDGRLIVTARGTYDEDPNHLDFIQHFSELLGPGHNPL